MRAPAHGSAPRVPPRALAALRQTAFLGDLTAASRAALAGAGRRRTLARGDVLFHEGRPGDTMYLLESGAVQLGKTTPAGQEIAIRTIRPGETFGEVVLFEQDRYPVTATVLLAGTALTFTRADVRRLLNGEAFRDDFIAMLMRKQRYLAERVRYLTTCDVEERLRVFLREQYGEGPRLQVTLSKRDIAAAIGTTPETLSRVIQRLGREGRLQWRGRVAVLNDPA